MVSHVAGPVRRRHRRADLDDGRPLGRRGDQPPTRAAGRPRPAVHPDQRHGRRRAGRRGDLRASASCSSSCAGARSSSAQRGEPDQAGAEHVHADQQRRARAGSTGCSRSRPARARCRAATKPRPAAAGGRAAPRKAATTGRRVSPTSTMTDVGVQLAPSRDRRARCDARWPRCCGRRRAGPLPVTTVPSTSTAADDDEHQAGERRGRGPPPDAVAERHEAATTARTVTAMIAIDSRKCSATSHGLRSVSTVIPPSTACAGMPAQRPARRARTCAALHDGRDEPGRDARSRRART